MLLRPLLLALMALTLPAAAQESRLVTLETGQDSRGWEAVGRLDISGKGFCTAALIEDNLILTAAHCVYDYDNSLLTADRFTFQAGLRNGRAEATRGVTRFVAHPDYLADGPTARVDGIAMDIAVLELDRPIRHSRVQPFPVAAEPQQGDQVGVVSYGQGREDLPSLQEVCSVLGQNSGAIIMTCDIERGSSGSPVFAVRDGRAQIVSVISAMAAVEGEKVSVGTSLGQPLRELRAHFATIGPARIGGTQRIILNGERNDTGAKFVQP
ncbi:trypsin-like serine peptidase [Yoonia sp. 208BN28-4]|uniref:trypsin-like serine peptidase n=1 Tax=Yoonia sp. 208BN28-4 TaxID=3126505 RepID=UPI0030AAA5ED